MSLITVAMLSACGTVGAYSFVEWDDDVLCMWIKQKPNNAGYLTEAANRDLSCDGLVTSSQKSLPTSTPTPPLAGIDIENDPNVDFFRPPNFIKPMNDLLQIKGAWQMGDFNNDGYVDVIYAGGMHPTNSNRSGETTAGACGGDICEGTKPPMQVFLGDENHELTYATELFIDNREDPGMALAMNSLIADYNNDGVFDFYVWDTGLGTWDGYRDSYYLSQPNGTWLESSSTHLSHEMFYFNHGAATGDIDNDGDMDIVMTNSGPAAKGTNTKFWCLMNDGTGFMKKRKCGGKFAFGLELADMDGDGDLDAVVGGTEISGCSHCNFTGIVWNDGRGNFNDYNTTSFPHTHKKKWGTIPEVSMADLDGDGDLDIIYSRVGYNYAGTAVQIIENLGNKKFRDHGIIALREAPEGYVATHEANPYNDFITMIKFRDFDKDGDIDVYLGSLMSGKTNGTVLINDGDFNFTLIKPNKAYPLYAKDHDH